MPNSSFKDMMQSIVSGKPTFLLMTSENCPPCEKVKPVYSQVSEVLAELGQFFQANIVDLPPEFVASRRVRSAPTLLMFRFGLEEGRLQGEEDLATMGPAISEFVNEYQRLNVGTSTEFECEACQ